MPVSLFADKLFRGDSGWIVAGVLIAGTELAQLLLLAMRAQNLLGLRIVALDGSRASLGAVLLVRSVANALLCMIPGIGNFYFLVDSLCVFRADRRCLHDLLAGTRVVRA